MFAVPAREIFSTLKVILSPLEVTDCLDSLFVESQIEPQSQLTAPSAHPDTDTDTDTDDLEEQREEDIGQQSDTTSLQDSTEEQKNKDESSVMVKNGSYAPSENEASDKDNEETDENLTQIEAGANDDVENVTSE